MLKDAIVKKGVYNAVVLDEFNYYRKKPSKFLVSLENSVIGKFFNKIKTSILSKNKKVAKKLSKKERRIKNAIIRFNPEYILTVTPFAQNSVVEAKIIAGLKNSVVYFYPYLTADKSIINSQTDLYLLENGELKNMLVDNHLSPKKAVVLGLPYSLKKLERDETNLLKQEFGLPKSKTVLLNANDKKECENILSLLVDQGDIINVAVNCANADVSHFGNILAKGKGMTIQFIKSENLDKLISVSDILITECDIPIIYKAFGVKLPVISFARNSQEEKDLNYLRNNGLIIKSEDNLDIVKSLYTLLQTNEKCNLQEAGAKFVEISSLDNITDFLTSFTEFYKEEENGDR